jgi:hypothetical protein
MAISLAITFFFFIFFGWLSDKLGPKIIVMAGCIIFAIATYPIFMCITHFANPGLEAAMKNAPAVVIADPTECHFQFAPSELKHHIKFTSSCDILKGLLGQYSVSYKTEDGSRGSLASVKLGDRVIESIDITDMSVGIL